MQEVCKERSSEGPAASLQVRPLEWCVISCWQLIHYWVFAFKVNFSRTPISKAPFELDLTSTPVESSIPEAVLHRVSGKQAPPAPHKQRLLVAAAKEAKAEAKGKADPKEAKKTQSKG